MSVLYDTSDGMRQQSLSGEGGSFDVLSPTVYLRKTCETNCLTEKNMLYLYVLFAGLWDSRRPGRAIPRVFRRGDSLFLSV